MKGPRLIFFCSKKTWRRCKRPWQTNIGYKKTVVQQYCVKKRQRSTHILYEKTVLDRIWFWNYRGWYILGTNKQRSMFCKNKIRVNQYCELKFYRLPKLLIKVPWLTKIATKRPRFNNIGHKKTLVTVILKKKNTVVNQYCQWKDANWPKLCVWSYPCWSTIVYKKLCSTNIIFCKRTVDKIEYKKTVFGQNCSWKVFSWVEE